MKPHIKLDATLGIKKAIVCGSPERALLISQLLKDSASVAKNREYHSYLGTFEGSQILVTSHGVGSAGAAICFQELCDIGVTTMIRLGTAGGFLDDCKVGDIVIGTAAIRRDGVSSLMVPLAFPAVSDFGLTQALTSHIQSQDPRAKAGIILSTDVFYPGLLDNESAFYAKAGAIAVEMESSALFVIGLLRKIRTACVVVLDGNPLKVDTDSYDPSPDRLRKSIELSARAIFNVLAKH